MDDKELVESFKHGSTYEKDKAFNRIVSLYRERLYAVIRGFTNDHDDTDDLLQETFVKAFEHLHKFRGESSLYTWLCRIAINQSISFQRKKKLKNLVSLENLSIPLRSRQQDPEGILQETELKNMIREAVDQLSEKQKIVFNLRFYDELSHAEIAKITGNSIGTIKANFFHAIHKVKQFIEKRYGHVQKMKRPI